MKRPKLLDLYCGEGGAAVGYHRAGFQVTGVDNLKKKRYPFKFILDEGISYISKNWHKYDAIHMSPPCQKYTCVNTYNKTKCSNDLELLLIICGYIPIPWVIENVPNAPLPKTISLFGPQFNLNIIRKRIFYSNIMLFEPGAVPQKRRYYPDKKIFTIAGAGGKGNTVSAWSAAIKINWMTRNGLRQSIPPAYTEFIGNQLITFLTNKTQNHEQIINR